MGLRPTAGYVLEAPLGRGGQATVFAARRARDDRRVALKLPASDDAAARARIAAEARVLDELVAHRLAGIVEAIETCDDLAAPWIAMERLAVAPPQPGEPEAWLRALLEALDGLHAHGWMHGDLSPRNVMLRGTTPVLIDLGSAIRLGGREQLGAPLRGRTTAYAAPELHAGAAVDHRADLYALGRIAAAWSALRPDVAELVRALGDPVRERRPSSARAALDVLAGRRGARSRDVTLRAALVGREAATAELQAIADEARRGRARAVIVTGESGIGKTRLVNELGARWVRDGWRVIMAGAEPPVGDAAIPRPAFALFAEVFGLGTAPTADQQLARAVEALAELAEPAPLAIMLDDLQWADAMSLALVASPQLAALDRPLLLVGTARREELPAALAGVPAIAIDRLTRGEVGAIAAELLGANARSELTDALYAHSEGNPFFVTAYLALVEQDAAAIDALPPSIGALFERRFAQLAPETRARLCELAAIGRDVPARWFDEAPELEVLEASGFLARAGAAYRFTHDKWREAALARIPVDDRAGLHRGIAARLERDGADPGAIGWHWARAGEPARALPHLLPAADAARATHSPHRAAELYAAALAAGGLDDAARCELWEARAAALVVIAHHEAARTAFATARTCTRDPVTIARLHRRSAASHWIVHDFAGSRTELAAALAALGEPATDDAHREWIEIQHGAFLALYFDHRSGGPVVEEHVRALGERVERHGTPVQQVRHAIARAGQLNAASRFFGDVLAATTMERGVAIAETAGDAPMLADALFNLGFARNLPGAGDLPGAEHALRRAHALAVEQSDLSLAARALTYLAINARKRGDRAACVAIAAQARSASERARFDGYVAACLGCTAWGMFADGDVDQSRRLLDQANAARARSPQVLPFYWSIDLVELALVEGELDRLAAIASRLLDPMQQRLELPLERALAALATGAGSPRERSTHARAAIRAASALGYL
jgi:eukaryotic-like serine/threonine-protein kinase